jgi:hypothetical protein
MLVVYDFLNGASFVKHRLVGRRFGGQVREKKVQDLIDLSARKVCKKRRFGFSIRKRS